ncbi:MAG: peptidylprolyl isomerase [Bacteroidaceae bacterium]|nr:peptidylprolyl isomerase [Bacteroidaceae bacterium]
MKRVLYLFVILLLAACGSSGDAKSSAPAKVRMHTTAGVIDLRLYDDTPKHRDNFLKLVEEQQFDSLLFHRVIKDFMIQGGDPTSKNAPAGAMLGEGDLGYTIEAEFMPQVHFHRRGVLAAAREGDMVNPSKASSASQFYIVWGQVYTKEQLEKYKEFYKYRMGKELVLTPEQETAYTTVGGTPHLDGEYTVFGEVVSGLDVVETIQCVECDMNDRPLEDVRILKVEIIE